MAQCSPPLKTPLRNTATYDLSFCFDVQVCMIREFPWVPWVPWESHGNGKHRLNSCEWKREWEWWTGNGREIGIVVWKKFPLVTLIIFLALFLCCRSGEQACRLARLMTFHLTYTAAAGPDGEGRSDCPLNVLINILYLITEITIHVVFDSR